MCSTVPSPLQLLDVDANANGGRFWRQSAGEEEEDRPARFLMAPMLCVKFSVTRCHTTVEEDRRIDATILGSCRSSQSRNHERQK